MKRFLGPSAVAFLAFVLIAAASPGGRYIVKIDNNKGCIAAERSGASNYTLG